MPIPDNVTPTNLRRIEFTTLDKEHGWVPRGQAWVDEHGRVQGDTEYVSQMLDSGISPNVLGERTRTAIREDGDLELAFGPAVPELLVWMEIKHHAGLPEYQLPRYRNDIDNVPADRRVLALVAPRDLMPSTNERAVTWQEIARFLRQSWTTDVLDETGTFLVREFLAYLEEEGLTDADALTAAHAFSLAARPATDRTIATLLQLADRHIRKEWGSRAPGSVRTVD